MLGTSQGKSGLGGVGAQGTQLGVQKWQFGEGAGLTKTLPSISPF